MKWCAYFSIIGILYSIMIIISHLCWILMIIHLQKFNLSAVYVMVLHSSFYTKYVLLKLNLWTLRHDIYLCIWMFCTQGSWPQSYYMKILDIFLSIWSLCSSSKSPKKVPSMKPYSLMHHCLYDGFAPQVLDHNKYFAPLWVCKAWCGDLHSRLLMRCYC